MLRSYSLNNQVHDRAMDDFIAQERSARSKVERELSAYRELLSQLANRLDGQNFEAKRQNDPSIPGRWTPAEWHDYLMQAANDFAFRSTRWGVSDEGLSRKEREALEAEIENLKNELKETRAHLLIAERKAEPEPPAKEKRYYPEGEKHTPPPVTPETAVSLIKPESLTISPFATTLDEYRHAMDNFPPPPVAYKDFAQRDSAWIKYVSHVYLIGHYGISSMMEIFELIGRAHGTQSNNGSLGRKTGNLEGSYLRTDNLSVVGSHIKVACLTPAGRVMYKSVFGKEPIETEWERLIRLHRGDQDKAHAAACLIFTLQARWRGYATTVVPNLPDAGRSRPDALIEKDGQSLAVEVELSEKDNPAKWRNQAKVNGGVVVLCAGTEKRRQKLAEICRREKFPGMATDIEFFRSPGYGKDEHTSPLWREEWT
jgi:hypothetical protein